MERRAAFRLLSQEQRITMCCMILLQRRRRLCLDAFSVRMRAVVANET